MNKYLAEWLNPDVFKEVKKLREELDNHKLESEKSIQDYIKICFNLKGELEAKAEELEAMTADRDKYRTDLHALELEQPGLRDRIKAEIAEAHKPKWREHLVFIFEREGSNYSRFDSAVNMPLRRQVYMQQALRDHEMKLSAGELGILLKIIEDSLEKAVNETGKDGKLRMQHLKTASFAIQEIQNRKDQQIFSPSIIAEICAVTIIRDDEDPAVIDPNIHAEKVDGILHRWGGDEDFFPLAGVDTLIEKSAQLKPVWKELWGQHVKLEESQATTYRKIAAEMQSTTTTGTP